MLNIYLLKKFINIKAYNIKYTVINIFNLKLHGNKLPKRGEKMDSKETIKEEEHELDEQGRIIIAENVPLLFTVNIEYDE